MQTQTHGAPQNLIEECLEKLQNPEPDHDRAAPAICGVAGLLLLVLMLLIATGTVPLYEWQV